jgi:hypothetical protein
VAFESRHGCHDGRDEVRAALVPLAAFEVTVRRRGAALARLQLIRIHAEAHRASGLAPFETRFPEDFVEAFGFRLVIDEA